MVLLCQGNVPDGILECALRKVNSRPISVIPNPPIPSRRNKYFCCTSAAPQRAVVVRHHLLPFNFEAQRSGHGTAGTSWHFSMSCFHFLQLASSIKSGLSSTRKKDSDAHTEVSKHGCRAKRKDHRSRSG
uniref:(northern house mosquito) hypothetical protein n=1 Tax=Culex pipiens TaxID=7175 RepID=A0A8D8I7Z9_CULPI